MLFIIGLVLIFLLLFGISFFDIYRGMWYHFDYRWNLFKTRLKYCEIYRAKQWWEKRVRNFKLFWFPNCLHLLDSLGVVLTLGQWSPQFMLRRCRKIFSKMLQERVKAEVERNPMIKEFVQTGMDLMEKELPEIKPKNKRRQS